MSLRSASPSPDGAPGLVLDTVVLLCIYLLGAKRFRFLRVSAKSRVSDFAMAVGVGAGWHAREVRAVRRVISAPMPHPWTVSRTAAATDRRTDGRVVARLRGAAVALGGGAAARRRRRRPATRSGSGPGAQGVCRRLGRDRGPRRHRRQAHDLVVIAVGRRVHAAVGPGQPATTATTSATAETASGRPRGATGPTEGLRTAADRGPPRGAAGTREFLTEFLAVSTKLY